MNKSIKINIRNNALSLAIFFTCGWMSLSSCSTTGISNSGKTVTVGAQNQNLQHESNSHSHVESNDLAPEKPISFWRKFLKFFGIVNLFYYENKHDTSTCTYVTDDNKFFNKYISGNIKQVKYHSYDCISHDPFTDIVSERVFKNYISCNSLLNFYEQFRIAFVQFIAFGRNKSTDTTEYLGSIKKLFEDAGLIFYYGEIESELENLVTCKDEDWPSIYSKSKKDGNIISSFEKLYVSHGLKAIYSFVMDIYFIEKAISSLGIIENPELFTCLDRLKEVNKKLKKETKFLKSPMEVYSSCKSLILKGNTFLVKIKDLLVQYSKEILLPSQKFVSLTEIKTFEYIYNSELFGTGEVDSLPDDFFNSIMNNNIYTV